MYTLLGKMKTGMKTNCSQYLLNKMVNLKMVSIALEVDSKRF